MPCAEAGHSADRIGSAAFLGPPFLNPFQHWLEFSTKGEREEIPLVRATLDPILTKSCPRMRKQVLKTDTEMLKRNVISLVTEYES